MGKKVIGYEPIWKDGKLLHRPIYQDLGEKLLTTFDSEIPNYMPTGDAQVWKQNQKERR
jgi:hypothetical protein